MTAFDLSALTPAQRSIVAGAIARCDFPFELCLPALKARWGRPAIVVTWEPLEPYLRAAPVTGHHSEPLAKAAPVVIGDDHDHEHPDDGGGTAHPVEARGRVAGLAWTDGRIMLAPWLEPHPALAVEVWLAEGAHQVDFFFISAEQRNSLFVLFHAGDETPHGDHGWFEERGGTNYWEWAGETWMGAFTLAYSDVAPDWMSFVHKVGPEARPAIRSILGVPAPKPVEPAPLPPPVGPAPYFGVAGSRVFHDSHRGAGRDVEWATRELAVLSGRRPCGVCRP